MKLKHLVLGTLAILLMPIHRVAFALPSAVWVSTNDAEGYLNIRAAASTQSEIQGRAGNGIQLDVLQKAEGADGYYWYQVQSQAANGWVRSDFLSFVAPLTLSNRSIGCERAIASVKQELLAIANLQIESTRSNSIAYPDAPQGRTERYFFNMRGPAGSDVMNSPLLSSQLSGQIIADCPSIGQVSFGIWGSGWVVDYGLMPGGMLRAFHCASDLSHPEFRFRKPRWGESTCV